MAAFTVELCGAGVSFRPRAGAGRVAPQPRRPLSERRQRRAQHADPVHRPLILQPPSDARDSGRPRCCRSAPIGRQGARIASAAHRAALDLQRRPARAHPAHRLPELEPLAFRGHRHLVHGGSAARRRAPGGSAAISTRCRARRSAGRLDHDRWIAAHAAVADAWACRRSRRVQGYAFTSPNSGSGRRSRADDRDADRVAPARRSPAPRVRQCHGAGGVRHARSRGAGRHLRAVA